MVTSRITPTPISGLRTPSRPRPASKARYGDIPNGGGGDYLQTDYAIRVPLGDRVDIAFRAQDRVFMSGPLLHAVGADAILRVRLLPQVVPTLALFGERIFVGPENGAHDAIFGRAMLGLGLPGVLGVVTPFASLDSGNGKGLLINRVETRLSIGVRYAPF